MTREPLRFVHASHLMLGHPPVVGPSIPDNALPELLDVTIAGLQRIVGNAIQFQTDFVLLTGDIVDDSQASLQARTALRNACRQLDEAGIPVFIAPDRDALASSWDWLDQLPENVVLLTDSPETLTDADDAPLAILYGLGAGHRSERNSRVPWSILCVSDVDFDAESFASGELESFDYVAVTSRDRFELSRFHSLAHSPGAAIALDDSQVGDHGCSLVEIGHHGASCRFIPSTELRWETLDVDIDAATSWDHLLQQMQDLLDGLQFDAALRFLFVTWRISGTGPICESLLQQDCSEDLAELLAVSDACRLLFHGHSVEFVGLASVQQPATDELLTSFLDNVRASADDGHPVAWPEAMDEAAISRMIDHLEWEEVHRMAGEIGRLFLTSPSDDEDDVPADSGRSHPSVDRISPETDAA